MSERELCFTCETPMRESDGLGTPHRGRYIWTHGGACVRMLDAAIALIEEEQRRTLAVRRLAERVRKLGKAAGGGG